MFSMFHSGNLTGIRYLYIQNIPSDFSHVKIQKGRGKHKVLYREQEATV